MGDLRVMKELFVEGRENRGWRNSEAKCIWQYQGGRLKKVVSVEGREGTQVEDITYDTKVL